MMVDICVTGRDGRGTEVPGGRGPCSLVKGSRYRSTSYSIKRLCAFFFIVIVTGRTLNLSDGYLSP